MFKDNSKVGEDNIQVLLIHLSDNCGEIPSELPLKMAEARSKSTLTDALQKTCDILETTLLSTGSIQAGLAYVASHKVAVVVFDLCHCTHLSSELTNTLRHWQLHSQHPVLFLVAGNFLKHLPNFFDEINSQGIVDILGMPSDQKILNSKIKVFVELHRKEILLQKQSSLLNQNANQTREREFAEVELRALQREQQAQQNYRDLVEGISDCVIWAADLTLNNISFVSSRAESILGYSLQRWFIEPNFLMTCLHPEDKVFFREAIDKLQAGFTRELAIEHRLLCSDGRPLWFHTSLRLTGDEFRGLSTDITRLKETEEALRDSESKLRFLVDVTALLGASLDHKKNLSLVCNRIVEDFADWCVVDLVTDDGSIERVQISYADKSMAEWAVDLSAAYPAVLTADAKLLGEENSLLQRDDLKKLGLSSVMAIPLKARNQILGSITFGYRQSHQSYSEEDLIIAQELGRRMSVSVDNTKLYRAEQKARFFAQRAQEAAERSAHRIAKLQATAAALSEAMTTYQVGRVAASHGASAMDASAAFLLLKNRENTVIHISEPAGLIDENIDTDSVEWALLQETMDTGRAVFIDSREKFHKKFSRNLSRIESELAEVVGSGVGRAFVSIPFVVHGKTEGALCLTFQDHRNFSRDDQSFMLGLARQCAQALDRAQLYESEKAARSRAESEERRRAFLAEASLVLSESLDYQASLKRVGQMALLELADWYAIHLIDTDQTIRLITVEHSDPEKVTLAEELYTTIQSDPEVPFDVAKAIQTGQSVMCQDIPLALEEAGSVDPHYKLLIDQLNLKSAIVVPLIARGKTLGAMTLFSAESGNKYVQKDLSIAEDLARRTAIAIDNAHLYRDAQDAILARDEFLSIASHELKTPLTPLKLQTQLIMRMMSMGTLADLDPIKMERILKTSDRQITRLSQLVEELLDISRLRVGRLRLNTENFDLCELITDVVEKFRDQLIQTKCSVDVICIEPVVGNWDKFRLEQVFVNLLTNAMKYGPGKPIELEVLSKKGAFGFAEVRVRDSGIGIAKKDQKRIFNRFERAVSANHFGGLGLGLYIVSQVLEAHGGTILIDSEPGQGATFIIQLPLNGLVHENTGPDSAA